MIDTQPTTGLLSRDPGKNRVTAEPPGPERKPRTRGQDAGGNCTALDEFDQTRLDEDPMLGLDCARI